MTKRIKRIAPLQLGKLLAVMYGLLSVIFVPLMLIAAWLAPDTKEMGSDPIFPRWGLVQYDCKI